VDLPHHNRKWRSVQVNHRRHTGKAMIAAVRRAWTCPLHPHTCCPFESVRWGRRWPDRATWLPSQQAEGAQRSLAAEATACSQITARSLIVVVAAATSPIGYAGIRSSSVGALTTRGRKAPARNRSVPACAGDTWPGLPARPGAGGKRPDGTACSAQIPDRGRVAGIEERRRGESARPPGVSVGAARPCGAPQPLEQGDLIAIALAGPTARTRQQASCAAAALLLGTGGHQAAGTWQPSWAPWVVAPGAFAVHLALDAQPLAEAQRVVMDRPVGLRTLRRQGQRFEQQWNALITALGLERSRHPAADQPFAARALKEQELPTPSCGDWSGGRPAPSWMAAFARPAIRATPSGCLCNWRPWPERAGGFGSICLESQRRERQDKATGLTWRRSEQSALITALPPAVMR